MLRRLKHSLNRPPVVISPKQGWRRYFEKLSPLGDRLSFAKVLNKYVVSAVRALPFWKIPRAILGRVRTIVVNSFNRVFWAGSWPHITLKAFKTDPSFANRNSASSVSSVVLRLIVSASGEHSRPNPVYAFIATSMGCLANFVSCNNALKMEASARSCISVLKIWSPYNLLFSTVASAIKHSPVLDRCSVRDNRKASISFPDVINFFTHENILIRSSFNEL